MQYLIDKLNTKYYWMLGVAYVVAFTVAAQLIPVSDRNAHLHVAFTITGLGFGIAFVFWLLAASYQMLICSAPGYAKVSICAFLVSLPWIGWRLYVEANMTSHECILKHIDDAQTPLATRAIMDACNFQY